MKKIPGDSEQTVDTPERRAFEIHRRADNIFYSLFEKLWAEGEQAGDPKQYLANSLIQKISELLPEASEEVSSVFEALAKKRGYTKKQFVEQSVEAVIQLLSKNLTLAELEKRLKIRPVNYNDEELSRGLSCGVKDNKVELHIGLTFFSNAKEALESLIEGLRALAQKIKTEEKYKNVTEIIGYSELVKEKHRLLTKYGFTITKNDAGQPTDEAKISKEKLLELFGG